MGRFSFSASSFTPPRISVPSISVPSIPTPTIPDLTVSYGGSTTPNIPIPNIPTPGGSFENLPGGMSLLTENVGYVADEVLGGAGKLMHSALDRAAKASKEAISGQGGYADDAGPDAPGPGETGYEDATGTLLTRGRKREIAMGRAFHSGGGSASTV